MREGVDLPDLLTDLLINYLDTRPDIERAVAEPPHQNVETELKQRRSELRRLRTRLMTEGPQAPQWLKSYIADLESEIARLEGPRL
jgi:DNA repair exonuclease SbcCD ATPase subunit